MAAGRRPQRRTDDGRVRPRHTADDAAADLVGRAPEAVAAARPLAARRRAADPPGRTADDGRAVADARAGAARHAGGAGLHAGAALSAAFRPEIGRAHV